MGWRDGVAEPGGIPLGLLIHSGRMHAATTFQRPNRCVSAALPLPRAKPNTPCGAERGNRPRVIP